MDSSLKYHLFDWDDNILNMSTKIHVEHLINGTWVEEKVSTSDFTDVRHHIKDYYNGIKSEWRYVNDDPNNGYLDFRDYGSRGNKSFLEDTIESIENKKFGPVWGDFIDCLVGGHLFSIITARGHEPETIKETIKWIVYNYLSIEQFDLMVTNLKNFNTDFKINIELLKKEELVNNYLEICDFIGVSSKWFSEKFNTDGSSVSPENSKTVAAEYFIKKVNIYGEILGKNVKVGFSDDDYKTIISMNDFFKYKLSIDFPTIDFNTYHTFDGVKHKL